MELLLAVGVVIVAVVAIVVRARSQADTSRTASTESLQAYVDPIDPDGGTVSDPAQDELFDAAQEMMVDDIEMEVDTPSAAVGSVDEVDGDDGSESDDSEIGYAELLSEAPDYVPDDLLEEVSVVEGEADESGVDGTGTQEEFPPPLAQRTPKDRSDDRVGGGELRMAQTNQRPGGQKSRSPEEVRSLLSNYRGGLERGRDDR